MEYLVKRIGNWIVWGGSSVDYSMAYAAVRYMDSLVGTNDGNGVKDIISDMSANPTKTLEQAINDNAALDSLNINSISDFASMFKSTSGGVDFVTTKLVPTLSNSETGSLIGSDRMTINNNGVATGATYTNNTIVDETPFGNTTLDPLSTFNEIWPTGLEFSISEINIQAGANKDQTIKVQLVNAQSNAIGIGAVNLTTNANGAILNFDQAIETVSDYRSAFGAMQNRLEKAIIVANSSSENLTAAECRIRDVDIAKEMMKQTKNSILPQAAQAILAQANQLPQAVLQLLR